MLIRCAAFSFERVMGKAHVYGCFQFNKPFLNFCFVARMDLGIVEIAAKDATLVAFT